LGLVPIARRVRRDPKARARWLGLLATALVMAGLTQPAHAQTTCADPTRTLLAPAPSSCRAYDSDQASCSKAWAISKDGSAVSCFFVQGTTTSCQGCGPTNQANGTCANTCVKAAATAVPTAPADAYPWLASALIAVGVAALGTRRSRTGRGF
jgi:hypothetical protein